jgi:hypothetical protein
METAEIERLLGSNDEGCNGNKGQWLKMQRMTRDTRARVRVTTIVRARFKCEQKRENFLIFIVKVSRFI